MATVAKSQSLFNEINNVIDGMFKSRIDEASQLNLDSVEIGRDFYTKIFDEKTMAALELIASNPLLKNIMTRYERCYVMLETGYKLEVRLPVAQYLPSDWTSSWGNKYPKYNTPEVDAIMLARKAKVEAVTKELEAFKSVFRQAWDAVSNLNQLAKVWPPVMDLIKDLRDNNNVSYIERMNRKAAPRKAEKLKEVLAVDTAALNVAMLKARVAA